MFKRRHPLALLIEIGVVILVFGRVVAGVYYKFRATPFHDVRPLGGENVLVVRSPDQQYEPTVAVFPSTPGILVAASTDERADARIYTSLDRGRTWRSTPAPPQQRAACGQSHPDVAITGDGLEVVASLVREVC